MSVTQRERVVYEAALTRLTNRSNALKTEADEAKDRFLAAEDKPSLDEARDAWNLIHSRQKYTWEAEAALKAILAEEVVPE